MAIHQLLLDLLNSGNHFEHAYRARAVEAIRLCSKLEQIYAMCYSTLGNPYFGAHQAPPSETKRERFGMQQQVHNVILIF